MISTVLFDLDDTLVDVSSAARTAVVPWAAELGVDGTPNEIVRRWVAISQPHYRRYQRREVTFAQQRRARVRELAPHLDLIDDEAADQTFAAYLTRYEAAWVCFDDAVPALRRLRARGLRVGILTNGEQAHQELKLELVGLRGEVDLMITSSELTYGKPHPLAYAVAVERLGMPADEIVMVGDSLENDVLAALDYGLDAVLLDRRGEYAESPVPRIHTLAELAGRSAFAF